jgi:small subunit ribosomal protein S29
MPLRPCLRTLPLRLRDSAAAYTPLRDARWLLSAQVASFSTSASNAHPAPAKKKQSMEGPPKKGVRALRIKKKGRKERDAKPPAPGERKALRKRIVLSNTNALEVPHLRDLGITNMTDRAIAGQVLGLPAGEGEAVESLRAVEAFKVGQGWGYFRRPACLIRSEAVELARLMEEIEGSPEEGDQRVLEGSGIKDARGQTLRKLISGERGVGKSVLMLQTMAMAFMRQWVVINLPEGASMLPSLPTKY